MFSKIQLKRYTDVLVWALFTARGKKFKKGDIISIQYDLAAMPLVEMVFSKLLDVGMNPVLRLMDNSKIEKIFYEKANKKQLEFMEPGKEEFCENLNGRIIILAPDDITHLKDIDPNKISKAASKYKIYFEILEKREMTKNYGWALCLYPTEASAKEANMSIEDYTKQIIKACYLNRKDPVAEWQSLYNKAIKLKRWLTQMKVEFYRVKSDNMDIKIFPGYKRQWIGLSGHNIPSFELFISPDYRLTEGSYFANQPAYKSGNYVKWVKLEFKKGKVSKMDCDSDSRDFVEAFLATDKGAKYVGEFSLTDKRFSKIDKFMANTLFDENYGGKYGNCHIALGSSYIDTFKGDVDSIEDKTKLGFNDSAVHWDMVNDEKKTVVAYLSSGKEVLIYENGLFQYDFKK